MKTFASCSIVNLVERFEEKIEVLTSLDDKFSEVPESPENLENYLHEFCKFMHDKFEGMIDDFWQSLDEEDETPLNKFKMSNVTNLEYQQTS